MDMHDLMLALGPHPALSLAVLRELGLSRAEIARYFGVEPAAMRKVEEEAGSGEFPAADLPPPRRS